MCWTLSALLRALSCSLKCLAGGDACVDRSVPFKMVELNRTDARVMFVNGCCQLGLVIGHHCHGLHLLFFFIGLYSPSLFSHIEATRIL